MHTADAGNARPSHVAGVALLDIRLGSNPGADVGARCRGCPEDAHASTV